MSNQISSRKARHHQHNKKSKKKNKSGSSFFVKLITTVFVACMLVFLCGVGLFFFYAKDAPELTESSLDTTVSSIIYDANGEKITDIGAENREKINATQVPQLLADAVVSVEDKRFYKHIGVDPIRIIGSFVSNVRSGGLQGGSTLTQQLIKLSFFSTKSSDQTLKRKAQEAVMAIKLERMKSKQEILTYYINKVYMSNGIYGMQTAAKAFYGKPLDQLSLPQTALLAGLPNAPTLFDPYANPEAAKKRRDVVLLTMLQNNKISKSEYEQAVATPINDGLLTTPATQSADWKYYDNYIKEVIEEVKEKTGKNIYTDGLKVYTNLNINAQKRLYEIVNSENYVYYPDKNMQVAATLMDVHNGKVLAQIGGRNIPDGTILGYNLAVSTSRDFGSTVKPITDYAPAFEYLKYSTGKTIVDEPYTYAGTNIQLKNWDNQYYGTMTLRKALYLSRNVPAAKLFMDVGVKNVKKFLNGLDIDYADLQQFNAISSNTGTQDGTKYGVSSLKMAAAYAAFANGGTYYEPQYVNKIQYQDGSEQTFDADGTKAMEATTAYMITDVLKDVITYGTGTNAQIDGLIQAGKTGTSNYTNDELESIDTSRGAYPDISFVGYTPNYSLAVWTGYNDRKTPITDDSTQVASDVYRELMSYLTADNENTDWKMPSGLVRYGRELYLTNSKSYSSVKRTTPSYSQSSTQSSSSSTETTQEEIEANTSTSDESTNEVEPTNPNTNNGSENNQNGNGNNNNVPNNNGTPPTNNNQNSNQNANQNN
ncbi:PBP1A family penicillin-binding protein [uncultured Enterococcus sp.]|uniref:PBP1A family penicillin-binding protein n=1 Tax=uncultured Enterococcus sp. TaxID=167972 RepID=UPI00261D33DF|nr:PBP1A family penicillin-binding protein [uncultured Enterococcus sp.]